MSKRHTDKQTIGVDIDGTLTNFYDFVMTNSPEYMNRIYKCSPVNDSGYDIDDVYELKRHFIEQGRSSFEADTIAKCATEKFWNRYYLKYCFLTRMRSGARKCIKHLKKQGFEIVIVSSRNRVCEKSLVGLIVRASTKLQLIINGIFPNKTVLLPNDEEKQKFLLKLRPEYMIDDKPEMAKSLSDEGIKVILMSTPYNRGINGSGISRVENWDKVFRLISKHSYGDWKRFYKLARLIVRVGFWNYHPIYLNRQNLSSFNRTIYAPNHRQTLDSMFLLSGIKTPVHWVALKRFFDGEDSIFNNSKNRFLCWLTKFLFYNMEMVPIDREKNNTYSMLSLKKYLQMDEAIGMYPEGTTNKHPEQREIGDIYSGLFHLARLANAYVQPIAVSWDKLKKKTVVINFMPLLDSSKYDNYDELCEAWKALIIEGLEENRKWST